jgi:hypothetical protein
MQIMQITVISGKTNINSFRYVNWKFPSLPPRIKKQTKLKIKFLITCMNSVKIDDLVILKVKNFSPIKAMIKNVYTMISLLLKLLKLNSRINSMGKISRLMILLISETFTAK